MSDALANAVCQRCQARFAPAERIVNSNGELYHEHCFVCAQCFRPFPEGLFYEFEGRKYCEHDFQMLFAPCCGSCGEFIIGRVIKAMNNNWHPGCFRCELCDVELADLGFVKNAGRHLCRPCHNREKAKGLGKYICQRCHLVIDEQPLMFRSDAYHPDHFNCTHCGKELTAEARELKGELYCLPCHDKMGVPICGACRRPIEGRVVNALGKQWHVEHFVCAKCEKPFLGHRHYEKKGLAYCETHYNQKAGEADEVRSPPGLTSLDSSSSRSKGAFWGAMPSLMPFPGGEGCSDGLQCPHPSLAAGPGRCLRGAVLEGQAGGMMALAGV
nr:LIM and senescent cell antigen-like-containing domain protein 2 isoform X2 [Aotus nancymaae]